MWEQIRSNKRRTWLLMAGMLLLLLVLGFVIGEAVGSGLGFFGLGAAVIVWVVMSLVSYFQGDSILLSATGAAPIEHDDHPRLFNVVEEMKIASGMGTMPKVYLVNDMAMNAFAVGRDPDHAAVAVTAGLLGKLNRDELQGVVGHEVSHIVNRDVLLMSTAGVMVGAIALISEVFLRGLIYGGGRSRRFGSSGKGRGQGQAVMVIVALVMAILAPILGQVIYFAVSRRREYLADANAAVLTRYPPGLAGALEKLGTDTTEFAAAKKSTAPMFIVNPFDKGGMKAFSLTRTHPPIGERVRILRSMGGSVSYADYQHAMESVHGAGALPASALQQSKRIAAREAHPESAEDDRKRRMRDAGDALRKANKFIFLPCACGLKIKLPPDFKKKQVDCPRCSRSLTAPVAQLAAAGVIADAVADQQAAPDKKDRRKAPPRRKPAELLEITRKGKEWMSFECRCGATKTLSPAMAAPQMTCSDCGRTIRINYA